jgi:tRNA 2-selenouridine synthase
MPITRIDIAEFLDLACHLPVFDVRSEGEFGHAHFPGAISLPLFSNEERKVVGTAYKQESQQKAIKLGLHFFGKKMVHLVEEVEAHFAKNNIVEKTLIVHCWRGGMRSGGVAWLLDLYGFKVYTLVGGYKAFRRWGLAQLEKDYPIKLVGGYTGSGKTEVLHALRSRGHKVVDLEGLAGHKGSAFGNIGMPPQPSQEMFENRLALQLGQLSGAQEPQKAFADATIWMEDESQRLGSVNIPTPIFKRLKEKPLLFLEVPFENRLQHLVKGYGDCDKERLVNAVTRIRKRLGGQHATEANNHLLEGRMEEGFRILLHYYDRLYAASLQQKAPHLVRHIACNQVEANTNAQIILEQSTQQIHV